MNAAGSAHLPTWWRALRHAVVVALGWLLFGWLWWLVMQQGWDSQRLWWLVLGSLLVVPAITIIWILHNRAIYRRLGPRRGLRDVSERYDEDFNGRRIDADWSSLRTAACVHIDTEGGRKRYRAESSAGSVAARGRTP